ncbi:MAG: hypothetical protein AAF569_00015 [Pseudomonadota bacterium]
MIETIIFLAVLGLLWLAVSQRSRWQERAKNAERKNKNTRKAHAVKNTIAIDDDERQRVRDHFDSR